MGVTWDCQERDWGRGAKEDEDEDRIGERRERGEESEAEKES